MRPGDEPKALFALDDDEVIAYMNIVIHVSGKRIYKRYRLYPDCKLLLKRQSTTGHVIALHFY